MLNGIKKMLNLLISPQEFLGKIKKMYPDAAYDTVNQKRYIKCSLANNRLKVMKA